MAYCPDCGEKIDSESKFCNYCGSERKKAQKSVNNHQNKNPTRIIHVLGILTSLFFAPVGLVIGMYLITQKPEDDKRTGWIIFGIAFTISFLAIFILLYSINSQLGTVNDDLGSIYYRMGRMKLY